VVKNLRVKFKLLLIVELFAVVFLAFGYYAFDTMKVVRVDEAVFKEILSDKAALLDLANLDVQLHRVHALASRVAGAGNDRTQMESLFNEITESRAVYTNIGKRTNVKKSVIKLGENYFQKAFNNQFQEKLKGGLAHVEEITSWLAELDEALQSHHDRIAQDMATIRTELAKAEAEAMNKVTIASSNYENRKFYLIIVGVAFFLGSLFFFASPINRAITRPLNEVEAAAKKLSLGDLNAFVEYRSGDEFGSLTESFRKTMAYIKEASEVADALSHGDLTVSFTPRSEKDLLGKSLKTMTETLHSLIGKIKQSSIQLMSTATEIAATAKQQELTVNEFGASTNQIAAAVKEISATAQELSKTMNDVTQVASATGELADTGRTGMVALRDSINLLGEATGSISSKLYTISEKANDINVVVTTITKVADQTNLLSINAAIEAEKAGEYGVGFLVVAREIRRLADQTAVATLDIEQTVKQMQTAVSSGVMEMDKFTELVRRDVEEVRRVSQQFTQIIESVNAVIARFRTVHEGMEAQSLGAQQINQAMVRLSEGARQTATSLKDFNRSTEHMHEAVKGLKEELSRFKVNN